MRPYFKGRGEIFAVAGIIGALIAGVWFVYRATETWKYFDVAWLRPIVLCLCIASSLLPTLILYVAIYFLNVALIGSLGRQELIERKVEILTGLAGACVSGGGVDKFERDLVDELAWAKVKTYWRDR